MYKSDPPQCCYYISIFANIWYLIKLIHSIIIILRVFVFYKQRVLANFWGRKDSANCASRKRRGACYCPVHMKWAINSLFMPTTYTLNLFSVFHYLALMYKSDPHQCCYYISIFANIWYLIKLIHSIIIILRVYMFYKQRVLANFWGRKDSANCASRKRRGACYCAVHMKWAINSLFMPTTYTLNFFSVFHYLALMYKSDPPQCCYYISIFANIWYLIKLIHSIIIILRVFMFNKQRVLANFWGRKDSANCASRKRRGACYCAVHMKWAINSLFMPTTLSFRPQKSAKTRCIQNINMRKMIIIDWFNKI